MDFWLGEMTGTAARAIRVGDTGLAKCVATIFQLLTGYDNASMARGRECERHVINGYVQACYNTNGTTQLTFPSCVQHETHHWIAFSPDAILEVGIERILEVKTAENQKTGQQFLTEHNDQIQLGLMVTGGAKAVLLVECSSGKTEVVEDIKPAVWQQAFMRNACAVFKDYLCWFHLPEVDRVRGKLVLTGVVAKLAPTKAIFREFDK